MDSGAPGSIRLPDEMCLRSPESRLRSPPRMRRPAPAGPVMNDNRARNNSRTEMVIAATPEISDGIGREMDRVFHVYARPVFFDRIIMRRS